MRVLHDLVLIEPKKEEKSNLATPESAKDIPQEGFIIEIGPDVMGIKEGDEVIYKKWVGDIVSINGTEYIATRFEDILMILGED